MKKYIKINFLFLIVVFILFGFISVYAGTIIAGTSISYDNTKSGITSTNVQDAIDDLYDKASYGDATSDNISSGKTALINGQEVTGTGKDVSDAYNSGLAVGESQTKDRLAYFTIGDSDTPTYSDALSAYNTRDVHMATLNGDVRLRSDVASTGSQYTHVTLCFPIKMDGKTTITYYLWNYISYSGTLYFSFSDTPAQSYSDIVNNAAGSATLSNTGSGSSTTSFSSNKTITLTKSFTGTKWMNVTYVHKANDYLVLYSLNKG